MAETMTACSQSEALATLGAIKDKSVQRAVAAVSKQIHKAERRAAGLQHNLLNVGALYDRSVVALADQLGAARFTAYASGSLFAGLALHTAGRKIYGWAAGATPADEVKGFFRRPSTHVFAIDAVQGLGMMIGGGLWQASKRKNDPNSDPYIAVGSVLTGSHLLAHGLNTLIERYL